MGRVFKPFWTKKGDPARHYTKLVGGRCGISWNRRQFGRPAGGPCARLGYPHRPRRVIRWGIAAGGGHTPPGQLVAGTNGRPSAPVSFQPGP